MGDGHPVAVKVRSTQAVRIETNISRFAGIDRPACRGPTGLPVDGVSGVGDVRPVELVCKPVQRGSCSTSDHEYLVVRSRKLPYAVYGPPWEGGAARLIPWG